jgi:hypothetical protein
MRPHRPRSTPYAAALAATVTLLATARAAADPARDDGDEPLPVSAARSAESGAFLPFTLPASNASQRAYLTMQGGYDVARGGAVFDTAVQANIVGPLSLRGGAAYVGPDGALRPSVALTVQALRQADHGVDLSVYGGYQAQGFNRVPAASLMLSVGRTIGRVSLIGNLGYGYGVEQGEQYGELRLAGLVRALPNLHVGVDLRARVDLERDADEPENEPDWDLVAGPMVTWSVGHFALSASGGLSAIRFRNSDAPPAVGAIGQLLVGSSF